MKILIRAFGPIMDVIGRSQEMILPSGSTLDDLIKKLEKENMSKNGGVIVSSSNLIILVNGVNSKTVKNRILEEGDHVDLLSPFVGG